MKVTDASVYPYPTGDSTLARMALEATDLGFDSIVAIGEVGRQPLGAEVIRGVVISAASHKEVIRRVREPAVRRADVVFVNAGDTSFNRAVVGLREVNGIRNIHAARRNAFDHVAARSAAERGVAVDISLAPIIRLRGTRRQRALERYADILSLQRRYGFPLTISSDAHSILEQRSVREVRGLCALFGMTGTEVSEALASVGRFIEPEQPVRVVG
ncbi:MAG: RNase P subunit p30 family protein [Methanoculleus sp.]|uniref:RNase P subunit p30 family protein n=1 Tax=unclassified Methanoculleus TaxID=2619537 RepID=UPI0025D81E9C|nr:MULTISPECIES: RNase P subunit p30 family protein [unclassified Methanoculleus]MCK9317226.1 ribonuclease P [Methanoculleus sp.]MDD2253193.1 RNase P subunit p30 family protein [Methanoculleus sp.]MDD3215786.1 RNase P subunit p30 family protein [Methanoculleus sp.]MDD4313778.1 RNase P subunit p30 family protein [Methanoculleus sp.]MDD4470775.1 RNase P subunit p30 family protein [Methanoculleus sp.]